jgi:hypothetical protein
MALTLITGNNPVVLRRTHYFEDLQFIDCFSPHPDHEFLPAVPHVIEIDDEIRELISKLEAEAGGHRMQIARWLIAPGELANPSQPAASIDRVPPGSRTVHIKTLAGKVMATAATPQNALPSGEYWIPDGPIFTVKNYSGGKSGIDPFEELRDACIDIEARRYLKEQEKQVLPTQRRQFSTTVIYKLWVIVAILGALVSLAAHFISKPVAQEPKKSNLDEVPKWQPARPGEHWTPPKRFSRKPAQEPLDPEPPDKTPQ